MEGGDFVAQISNLSMSEAGGSIDGLRKFEAAYSSLARTPEMVRMLLQEQYRFTGTLVASGKTPAEEKALFEGEWPERAFVVPGKAVSVMHWLTRAIERRDARGLFSCVVIPVRTNTRWFHELCLSKGEVIFVQGRLKFPGFKTQSAEASALVVYDPQTAASDRAGPKTVRSRDDSRPQFAILTSFSAPKTQLVVDPDGDSA